MARIFWTPNRAAGTVSAERQCHPFRSMKTLNQLRTLSTSLSLVILALGFLAFGLAPLINKSAFTIGVFTAENAYSLIGSGFSILVGRLSLSPPFPPRRMRSGSESPIQQIDANLI